MQTSAQGIAALELEEGVVLRAYRDPVGVWTIGAGLTAASGVVAPKAGMVITAAEATNLLQRALREKYEPSVQMAMSRTSGSKVTRPKQHEFDAGVSFHWNTGAIRRASWVPAWLSKAPRNDILKAMMLWGKAGGKVLPGLVARRVREASMLLDGVYPQTTPRLAAPLLGSGAARWGLVLSNDEITAARAGFAQLGYQVGPGSRAVPIASAVKFQRDHDLTVDGIIGRATLSTLQRRLNARVAVGAGTPAAAGAGAVTSFGSSPDITAYPWVGPVVLTAVGVFLIIQAWRYRDVVAVKLQRVWPSAAAFLRKF